MENHSGGGLTSIRHLPDECLIIIFQHLHFSSDRESFGLTCQHWLHIQNISRRSLQFQCSFTQLDPSSLSQANLDINSFHLGRLLTRFQHLQSLSLSGCTELPDLGLIQLQSYGSKLQALYLDCCFKISDFGISLVAAGCPSLAVVSLYRCSITDVGLETLANGCAVLKDVNLMCCSFITDDGIQALSQRCRQLRAVKITSCWRVSGTGFTGCSPTLVHVEAEYCKLEPEGIVGIVSGGGLEYLNVSKVSLWFGGGGMATIGAGFAPRLKILNLRACRNIGDETIVMITKECPLLQEWNLALCHDVKIPGWESIGLNCHNLEKLHVNRCRNLCDRGLEALRDGCSRLSVLYMNQCSRISQTAVELFKLHRDEVQIKDEEIMCIGPNWTL